MNHDLLTIAGREFRSRLWVGTGKYQNFEETKKAIEASGADVVTVTISIPNNTPSYRIPQGVIRSRMLFVILAWPAPREYQIW